MFHLLLSAVFCALVLKTWSAEAEETTKSNISTMNSLQTPANKEGEATGLNKKMKRLETKE